MASAASPTFSESGVTTSDLNPVQSKRSGDASLREFPFSSDYELERARHILHHETILSITTPKAISLKSLLAGATSPRKL